jgi:uncharacterized membrane protein
LSVSGEARVRVLTVAPARAFAWLLLGWRDFRRAFVPSLAHGVLAALIGWVILVVGRSAWPLLPGAFSGFVLIAPILATGLYELSKRMEAGEKARWRHASGAWARGTRPLIWLGFGLALAATLWVLVSAVLIALVVKVPITSLDSFLRHVVVGEGSNLFPLWAALGGLGAAVVFAASVVSVPMLLDRDVDLPTALATSVRAVGENPGAMVVWAALVMLLTLASMATLMIGFTVTIPVLGHATWHVYREVVDAAGLPPRPERT